MSKSNENSVLTTALKPKYWPTATGLFLLWLLTLTPLRFQFFLGRLFGKALYQVSKRRRHIANVNIELCFPNLSQTEKQQILRRTFDSVGYSAIETPLSWWASNKRLAPLVHLHGKHYIDEAKKQGRGILLLGAHFTCLEIGGRLLTMHVPTINMYKKHRNALFEAVMRKNRLRHLDGLIEHRNVREYIRALKKGKVCWYAPDQDFRNKGSSVFASFMGVQAATLTAAARIAKMSNAIVIPFFPKRRLDGKGYDLEILQPIENFPTGDDDKDAALVNEIIAEQVAVAPDQYLWLHRRFKSRPEGEPSLYDQKPIAR